MKTCNYLLLVALFLAVLLAAGRQIGAVDRRPRGIGVQGRFEYGTGMVVERVRWRSPAGQLGLEPGDVIRAIDGRWLRTEADYRRQLKDAQVRALLIVRDVRTGRLIRRPINIR